MLILAADTSTKTASVALLDDTEVLAELFINVDHHHGETILPAIETVFTQAGVKKNSIDLFALTIGPGGFTGLRVGISTMKGMAFAMNKPVVGVSTLDALAMNAADSHAYICPMISARRDEVYTALYKTNNGSLPDKKIGDRIVVPEVFVRNLDGEVLFLGDGADLYKTSIKELLSERSFFAVPLLNYIRASAVGYIGLKKFLDGDSVSALNLVPKYIRASYAEINH